jgi:hypothetical protein
MPEPRRRKRRGDSGPLEPCVGKILHAQGTALMTGENVKINKPDDPRPLLGRIVDVARWSDIGNGQPVVPVDWRGEQFVKVTVYLKVDPSFPAASYVNIEGAQELMLNHDDCQWLPAANIVATVLVAHGETANSGHLGLPFDGSADNTYVIFNEQRDGEVVAIESRKWCMLPERSEYAFTRYQIPTLITSNSSHQLSVRRRLRRGFFVILGADYAVGDKHGSIDEVTGSQSIAITDEEWDIIKRVLLPGTESDASSIEEDESSSDEEDETANSSTLRELYYQPRRCMVRALMRDADTPERILCCSLVMLRRLTKLIGDGWHIGFPRLYTGHMMKTDGSLEVSLKTTNNVNVIFPVDELRHRVDAAKVVVVSSSSSSSSSSGDDDKSRLRLANRRLSRKFFRHRGSVFRVSSVEFLVAHGTREGSKRGPVEKRMVVNYYNFGTHGRTAPTDVAHSVQVALLTFDRDFGPGLSSEANFNPKKKMQRRIGVDISYKNDHSGFEAVGTLKISATWLQGPASAFGGPDLTHVSHF